MRKRIWVLMLAVMVFMVFATPAFAQEVEEVVEGPAFDLVWINGFLGLFLPLAISFFKKADWSATTKKVFAFVISALVGIVTVGAESGWSLTPFGDFLRLALASMTQVWIVAQVAYLSFWEGTVVEKAAERMGFAKAA